MHSDHAHRPYTLGHTQWAYTLGLCTIHNRLAQSAICTANLRKVYKRCVSLLQEEENISFIRFLFKFHTKNHHQPIECISEGMWSHKRRFRSRELCVATATICGDHFGSDHLHRNRPVRRTNRLIPLISDSKIMHMRLVAIYRFCTDPFSLSLSLCGSRRMSRRVLHAENGFLSKLVNKLTTSGNTEN